ncbi:MAG: hypothetical protein ACK55Z_01060, partial [bacterium]
TSRRCRYRLHLIPQEFHYCVSSCTKTQAAAFVDLFCCQAEFFLPVNKDLQIDSPLQNQTSFASIRLERVKRHFHQLGS